MYNMWQYAGVLCKVALMMVHETETCRQELSIFHVINDMHLLETQIDYCKMHGKAHIKIKIYLLAVPSVCSILGCPYKDQNFVGSYRHNIRRSRLAVERSSLLVDCAEDNEMRRNSVSRITIFWQNLYFECIWEFPYHPVSHETTVSSVCPSDT